MMKDLFEAKQALTGLVIEGKIEEIKKLDAEGYFGNLDVYACLEEMGINL